MNSRVGKTDFEGIARAALSQSKPLLESWLPAGRWAGREFLIGDIHGAPGESLSINSSTGAWADFGGDAKGGDLISLYAAINRLSQADAATQLSATLGQPIESHQGVVVPLKRAEKAKDWTAIIPVPDDAPAGPASHFKLGNPSHIARYLNRDSALVGLIYRFDLADGEKEFRPLTFCKNAAGRNEWQWQAFPTPRSLYGAELLCNPGRVLVVEGEKKAEAGRRMLGDAMIVIAWPGGAKAVAQADWSMLAGRDCVMWPDNDAAGRDAAAAIVIQLRHYGATARVIDLPADLPKKYDLADAERDGWSGAKVMRHIDPPDPDLGHYDPDPEPEVNAFDFAPLGHDHGRFYFFSSGGGQVRDFSARDLQSVGALCELAPLRYWEMNYPGKGDAGFNVRSAGDALIRGCYRAGIYDAERLRGRGAWLDDGRTVLHLGNRLIVDGHETSLAELRSQFIYEQGRRLTLTISDEQLSSDRAKRLMDLCVAAPWEDQESMGRLLAGWLVIAPICGAMPWRPHIWVTGEGGSGKTWIMDNLIKPVVGDIALQVASKTSEAGVRGDLGLDGRPVIFDEFETQNEADRGRVQQVLDLARQASSEDGAAIIKGTQTGGSRRYRVRSCFAFISINLGLQQSADESRTVVLPVKPLAEPGARLVSFERLQALHAEVVTEDFRPKLLARTLALLPTIRANAEVFASAIARSGVSRRTGDTIGVLLAGAWSLRSRRVATAEDADKFMAEYSWARSAIKRSDADPEWRRAVDFLVQVPLWISPSNSKPQDIPIGELIQVAGRMPGAPPMAIEDAEAALARAGIRIVTDAGGQCVVVANNSETLRKAFSSTAWASGWAATLARTPGADKLAKPMRFATLTSRGLKLPMKSIILEE